MEVLLNFVWLLLIVPAYWVWKRENKSFQALSRLFALSCVLVLLFPVISATDDLHAMLADIEEFAPSKRMSHVEMGKGPHHAGRALAALTNQISQAFLSPREIRELIVLEISNQLASRAVGLYTGRAPPTSTV